MFISFLGEISLIFSEKQLKSVYKCRLQQLWLRVDRITMVCVMIQLT